jgi:hypothetical protein
LRDIDKQCASVRELPALLLLAQPILGLLRAEIDGLRALAVISVMFHHYHVPGFRGGFVGVDVFFVISGFPIAAHIESQIAAGHFSLKTTAVPRPRAGHGHFGERHAMGSGINSRDLWLIRE